MYRKNITRRSRTAIVIAIDGSISMQEFTLLHSTRMRKMDAAALISNFIIDELITRATRAGDIRDYYDITVIQYSGDVIDTIIAEESGGMVPVNQLHNATPQPVSYNIVHMEDDGTQSTIPITLHEWVKPKAYGIAPMYEAFVHIKDTITKWCNDDFNRNSFPPTVINITAGCCGDAEEDELLDIADEIASIGTKDGATLLINIELTDERSEHNESLLFPSLSQDISHDNDGQMLYNMSSTLPKELEPLINKMLGEQHKGPYKCFARNASICEILAISDIGTEKCNHY